MPFSTQVLPNAPIIVHTHQPGPELVAEFPEAMAHVVELLNTQTQPVFLVLDLSGVSMGVDDLLKTSSDAARGPGAVLHHPAVIESLIVVTNKMMQLGMMGLTNEVFGSAKLRTFETIEQALEYAYARIAEMAQE